MLLIELLFRPTVYLDLSKILVAVSSLIKQRENPSLLRFTWKFLFVHLKHCPSFWGNSIWTDKRVKRTSVLRSRSTEPMNKIKLRFWPKHGYTISAWASDYAWFDIHVYIWRPGIQLRLSVRFYTNWLRKRDRNLNY